MTLKNLIIVSLVLAILTIGAVSASEDIMSEDTLNADTDDESISISDEDSQLNGEDDGGFDENDEYVEDEDPCDIFICESVDIDDDDDEFASVELKKDAEGNLSLKVNNQELVNKELSQFSDRYLDAYYEDIYVYEFYLKDLDYEFVADETYNIELSYYDGENTYTETGLLTPYKLTKIEQDGIIVEIRSRSECLIDFSDDSGFVFITAPAGADGIVAVVFDDGEKYSKTLSLSELDYDSDYEEYSVCVRHIDSNMEPGTHTIHVTYTQEGIEPISLSGNVTFAYDDESKIYKAYVNRDEVNVDDNETVLISLFCPEGSTGNFSIEFNGYEGFSKIEYPITEKDIGKTITWNLSSLNITEKGEYYISIYHRISDDNWVYIDGRMLKIVNNDEFRAKSSNAYVICDETEIISVFCPTGNAGAKITFKINDENYEEIGSIDYIVKEEDVGYVGFELKFFNITKVGEYDFEVLINDEHLDNLNVDIDSPINLPDDVDLEDESDAVAYIDLPTDKIEGRIVITINNVEYLNEYLSQLPDCIWSSDEEDTSYRIYPSNLTKEVEVGTHNVTVTYYYGEKSHSQSAMVEFYKPNIAEDEETGVSIELYNRIDSSFAGAIVPYDINDGVFSVLIRGIEHLKIDIATYEDYYGDESGKLYSFYPYMLDPEVKGTANVKIIYIVDGEDVIQVNGTLKFSDDETQDSELNFTQDEITIEEGSPATITFTTIGCSVSQDNITVKNYPDAEISLNDNEITISGLTAGTYTLAVTTTPEEGYNAVAEYLTITVTEKEITLIDPEFSIDIGNVEFGSPVVVRVSAVEAFRGVVTVVVDGHDVLVSVNAGSGVNSTDLGLAVKDGYVANLTFEANDVFKASYAETTFNVTAKETPEPAVLIDPKLELIIENVEEGTPVKIIVKTNATFTGDVKISSDVYNGTVKVNNGEGNTTITLPVAKYTFKAIFNETSIFKGMEAIASFNVTAKNNGSSNASNENNTPSDNGTNNTVPVKIVAKDLKVFYNDGTKFSVTVYGTDGKVAVNAQVIFKVNGKKVATAKTNAKGIATFKITQVPKTYKVTAEALGANITKKLTVKKVLTLKKVKVKRSAKKLVLKATLKQGKKALKGKKITFKFNGKKYTAKTNKKGVAKVTVKKNVLKKLKKGKKVKIQATYLKSTVKTTAKVK